ncbi:MAG TPA: polyhydroxybutyrate depolymerase [Rhizobium sp.]|nr:polyhydroxybutyrate depolymerase [Rhizobium sp.]
MRSSVVSGLSRPVALLRAVALGAFFIAGAMGSAHAAGCGTTVSPGYHQLSMRSGGLDRQAVLFVPASYSGKVKVPVVFDLHGSNSYPRAQIARSRWDDVADREGFLLVAPQGGLDGKVEGTHAWNVPGVTPGEGPDDGAFLKDVVETVKDRFCVDPGRIYASGYSGGGRMLSQYICNGYADFTSAGFVMSLRAGYPLEKDGIWQPESQSCHPAAPVSIIAFWGSKDNINPFAGGGGAYWQYSGETALRRWAELNDCQGDMKVTKGERISSAEFDTCKGGARILSYMITDGSHSWPGRSVGFAVGGSSDQATREVDAAGRMWSFFSGGDAQLVSDRQTDDRCTQRAVTAASETGSRETTCDQTGGTAGKEQLAAGGL